MKPNMTTVAAAGVIMFNNNKTAVWLDEKSQEDIERLVLLARRNRKGYIRKYREKKVNILQYKIDEIDKRSLEKEIKEQKASEEKEFLTTEIRIDGGLILCKEDLEKILGTKNEIVKKLQRQIKFRKKVLQQKFPENWLQLGEKGKGENYKKFSIETLKTNLLSIFTFLKEAPEQRATTIKCSVIRQIDERQEMLITLKKKVRLEGDARLLMETRKKIRTGAS
ncbi:uncharacterized protein LOC136080548 [Hydra vulgaris]|uniref:Uncharacterized protein LOC136080548 n=1 Tax=Hydra vulgaris TaxID=6087 RepID=A0ABM4BW40_HYDVU